MKEIWLAYKALSIKHFILINKSKSWLNVLVGIQLLDLDSLFNL